MSQKTNLIIATVLILVVIGVVIALTSQPFSVIAISRAAIGADGEPYWIFTVRPEGEGERVSFFVDKKDLEPVDDPRGGKWVAQESFSVQFKREIPACIWNLKKRGGFFGGSTNSWELFGTPTKEAKITIIPSKGDPKIVDGFLAGQSASFRIDGKELNVQTQGAFVGPLQCPEGVDIKVDKVQTREDTSYLQFTKGFFGSFLGNADEEFTSEFPSGCELDETASKLKCKKSFDLLGSPVLTVTSNSKYVNARYFPPSVGKPKVISIDAGGFLVEGKQSGLIIKVKNIGTSGGNFLLKIISPNAAVRDESQIVNLAAGEEKDITGLTIIGGNIEVESSNINVEAELCTITQFGKSECDRKTISVILKNSGIFTPSTCGTNGCQSNENFANCPSDCAGDKKCPDPDNMILTAGGQCICLKGELERDDYGRESCSEGTKFPWGVIAIVGGFILVAILMIVIATKKRNGGI